VPLMTLGTATAKNFAYSSGKPGTVKDDDFSLQARAEINVNVVFWTSHACSLLLTLRHPFTDT